MKGRLYIVTEYCEKGDLARFIRAQRGWIPEPLVLDIFTQVCLGLRYMHSKRVLHRDIKAMNIFLRKNNQIRIGDFGVAKTLLDEKEFTSTLTGTPFYFSPEVCKEMPYDSKSDIWALGCLLYELCCKTQPFKSKGYTGLKRMIKKGGSTVASSIYT